MLDSEGRSDWNRLHGRHRLKDARKIAHAAITDPAAIFVAKRADSIYTAGRSNCWQKVKTDAGVERERKRRP
jgi:ATP-dependent DNA ligase